MTATPKPSRDKIRTQYEDEEQAFIDAVSIGPWDEEE